MSDFESLYAAFDHEIGVTPKTGLRRLQTEAPLGVYYGRNPTGGYRIAFLSECEASEPQSTRAIKVSSVPEDGSMWLFFDLSEAPVKTVFFALCDDLVRVLEANPHVEEAEAVSILKNRFQTWRSMFSQSRQAMSEEQLVGLLGELYFLHTFMMPRFGAEKAVSAWGGADGLSKDFSIENLWFEIKTASVSSSSVKINSLAQLSSDVPGELDVVRYEKMSGQYDDPFCTVSKLFRLVMGDITDNDVRAVFLSKIVSCGFDIAGEEASARFRIDSLSRFLVNESFPRIMESDVPHPEIEKVTYTLNLNALAPYEIKAEN